MQISQPAVKQMRVFLGHGTADPLIPLPLANSTANLLRQKGGPIHLVHEYCMHVLSCARKSDAAQGEGQVMEADSNVHHASSMHTSTGMTRIYNASQGLPIWTSGHTQACSTA